MILFQKGHFFIFFFYFKEMPPPLPPRRNYKVNGNQKIFNQIPGVWQNLKLEFTNYKLRHLDTPEMSCFLSFQRNFSMKYVIRIFYLLTIVYILERNYIRYVSRPVVILSLFKSTVYMTLWKQILIQRWEFIKENKKTRFRPRKWPRKKRKKTRFRHWKEDSRKNYND